MPRIPFLTLVLAVLALVLVLAAGAAVAQEAPEAPADDPSRWARLAAERLPELEVCRPEGAQADMLCGDFAVWEDREARAGREIELHVVVVPARSEEPLPDPVVVVAGGPGEGVTGAAPFIPREADELLERRDVLLVDQRGTGESNGLSCAFGVTPEDPQPAYDAFFPLEGVKACREALEARADLTKYTTTIAVEDLEEVRRRLGYGPLNLVGGSYGTRFVQEFLRRHPESVRTAVLQGVTSMDHRMPLNHALDGQRGFDLLFVLCEEDPACREAFPDLRRELWAVVRRLEGEPGRATIENPLTGGEVTLSVGRGMFVESLRSLLYGVGGSTELPFVVHRAFQGDFAPFFKRTVPYRVFIETEFSNGLYLSVTCAEDTQRFTAEEAALHNAGTALGGFRTDAQKAACGVWPTAEVPADFHEPVATERPVLIVVGELDPVTPPRYGRAAAERMPNGLFVLVPRGHHSHDSLTNQDCLKGLIEGLIESGTTQGLDPSCVETMQRPPFVLDESAMGYMEEGEDGAE